MSTIVKGIERNSSIAEHTGGRKTTAKKPKVDIENIRRIADEVLTEEGMMTCGDGDWNGDWTGREIEVPLCLKKRPIEGNGLCSQSQHTMFCHPV